MAGTVRFCIPESDFPTRLPLRNLAGSVTLELPKVGSTRNVTGVALQIPKHCDVTVRGFRFAMLVRRVVKELP